MTYSLRFRLMVLCLLVFLVLATLMMTAMPYYYQNSLSTESRTLTEGTLTSIARNIETYLDDLNRLTIAPYLNEDIMDALQLKASPDYAEADAYTRLSADRALKTTLPLYLQNSRGDILATVVVAPDGSTFIASVGGAMSEPAIDYPYLQQDWYQKAVEADGEVVFISSHTQDYLDGSSGRQVFSVARLIKDPDTRQPLAVIMADADTNVLAGIVSDINFNVSSIVCIFDDQDKLLYSSQPISADLQGAVIGSTDTVRADGDSYLSVTHLISPAQWKVVVLLSNAELAAKTRWIYAMGILFAVGGLLLTFLLFFILARWIVHPFDEMITVMQQVQTGNLQTRFIVKGNDEIARLGQALNDMIERLNQLIEREYKAVLSQRDAEYRALQSQIQPHFLYNTLNGFIGLNRLGNSAGLEKAIFALSSMLHYILEGDEMVPLDDEITFVEKYCNLQRIRFRERLDVEIRSDPSVVGLKVPKLILQPLVENAFIHGIEPAGRACKLTVLVESRKTADASWVRITVQDNGRGFDPLTLKGKDGLGLANVRERLNLAFREAEFAVTSQVDAGTRIVIDIPAGSHS
jgi:two-component system sensor histidine kinase YesM